MTAVQSEWVETTLEALHRKGLRNGGARRAVIDLLAEQDCCLTAQEIFDRLRASGRRVGIASVYRVLELLTSEGFVQRIDLGAGISRYEPIHSAASTIITSSATAAARSRRSRTVELERAIHRLEATLRVRRRGSRRRAARRPAATAVS